MRVLRFATQRESIDLKEFKDFCPKWRKLISESGLDCLMCAAFARLRSGTSMIDLHVVFD
jgi:hypothetical protein